MARIFNFLYEVFYLVRTHLLYKPFFGKIGKFSILYGSFIRAVNPNKIFVGANTRIMKHARLEIITSWKEQKFLPKVEIGNNVNIGHNFFLSCASNVTIEDGVLISDNVAIIDNIHVYGGANLSSSDAPIVFNQIVIKKNVVIYRNSTILAGVSVGQGAVVGANSVVKNDVLPNTMVVGSPAKVVRVYDEQQSCWIRP